LLSAVVESPSYLRCKGAQPFTPPPISGERSRPWGRPPESQRAPPATAGIAAPTEKIGGVGRCPAIYVCLDEL
jgi:hypothetical protein